MYGMCLFPTGERRIDSKKKKKKYMLMPRLSPHMYIYTHICMHIYYSQIGRWKDFCCACTVPTQSRSSEPAGSRSGDQRSVKPLGDVWSETGTYSSTYICTMHTIA